MFHRCAFIDCPCLRPFHRHHLPCRQDPVLVPFRDRAHPRNPDPLDLPNPFHPLFRKGPVLALSQTPFPEVLFRLLVA